MKEEIELSIADSSCSVAGIYFFENKSPFPIKNSIFYPFAVNNYLLYPDAITVFNITGSEYVQFTRSKNGVFFYVSVNAFSTALYRVCYAQKTNSFFMQYLLRTTALWGKPFKQAIYRVRIPEKFILTYSTIVFSRLIRENNEQVYEKCEEDFMPSDDFIVKWESKLP